MLAAQEEQPAALARSMPLPRPTQGSASRVQIGRAELVLEHCRGSYSLLWSNGREARRYVLGLNASGQLSVELRAPRLPVHIVPRELMTIVPGARMRGFITVPLVPTIVWRDGLLPPQRLIELHPANLQGHWQEAIGHSLRCAASWMVRFPFQTGEPQVVVPMRLYNSLREPACPGELELRLADDDLIELRGAILVRPRRLEWTGESMVEFELARGSA
jgi:hypothetical protein